MHTIFSRVRVAALAALLSVPALASSVEWCVFDLSFFPPVEIPVPWWDYSTETPWWGECDVYGLSLGVPWASHLSVYGLDVGVVQMCAEDFAGVQVGVFNYAASAHGLQIGIVNWATDACGAQIGLCNFITKGPVFVLPVVNVGF